MQISVFLRISRIATEIFDGKTGQELENIRDHFSAAYSEAQLCALVVIGMILRIFHILPKPPKGSRSMWFVVAMLVQFLQNLDENTARGGPNPLDEIVDQAVTKIEG